VISVGSSYIIFVPLPVPGAVHTADVHHSVHNFTHKWVGTYDDASSGGKRIN
jgi:hypothetical protein